MAGDLRSQPTRLPISKKGDMGVPKANGTGSEADWPPSAAADKVSGTPDTQSTPDTIPAGGHGSIGTFQGNQRFELLRMVGKGAVGLVYEAIDHERDERIALKTMHKLQPSELYRLKREFRSLADIVHPNLVRLYELFSDGHEWFYTMELVDGVDFLKWVRPTTPSVDKSGSPGTEGARTKTRIADFDRIRNALCQLGDGLQMLHDEGKLHCDVKPSNILVRCDGQTVLLDFGLIKDFGDGPARSGAPEQLPEHGNSSETQSLATEGGIAGTIRYMSPEQAAGSTLTPASDWYSVGVILFEALTGRPPFLGGSIEVMLQKETDTPPRPGTLTEDIPEDLETLCLTLLLTEPAARMAGLPLLDRLRTETPVQKEDVSTGDVNLPFIGREHQLQFIRTAFERIKRGHSSMLHLRGRSGVGKSTLANRFLVGLKDRGEALVLGGRCYEQETVPFKALDSIVDSLSRHFRTLTEEALAELLPSDIAALSRIFPVLDRVPAILRAPVCSIADPFKLRRIAFVALARLLCRLGENHNLVLYIDDLQWGDADSAIFLRNLIESSSPPRMLFIASYRSEYRDSCPCLQALTGARTRSEDKVVVEELEVTPLADNEARSLAEALLGGDPSPSIVQQIAADSGGNPYFVYELAKLVDSEAGLEGLDRPAGSESFQLDQALWARVQRLADIDRTVLEAIAVSGQPTSLRTVLGAASMDSSSHSPVAILRAERFIRCSGPGLNDDVECYHDRIRESIVANLDETKLCGLHLKLARALEKNGSKDPERMAVHFHGSGELIRAGRLYERAATQAAEALAFDHAAKLYRESIGCGGIDDAEKSELTVKLATALGNAGRGRESALAYLAASGSGNKDEDLRLQRQAGFQYCVAGHIDEGRECFRGVLDHIGLQLPKSRKSALFSLIRRRLLLLMRGTRFRRRDESQVPAELLERIDLSWEVAGGITVIDPIPAAEFQTHNLLLALKAGEPFRIARALAWEASHVAMIGQRFRSRVDRLLDEAAILAKEIDDPMLIGTVDLAHCVAAFFLGDFQACRQFGDRAAEVFRRECAGAAWELDQSQTFAFWSCYWLGDLVELRKRQENLLQVARNRGARLVESQLTTFGGPFVWLAQDDPVQAKSALANAAEHWEAVEYQVYHYTLLTAKSQIALYENLGVEALEMIEREWPLVASAMLLHVEIVRVYMHFLRARCALAAADQQANPERSQDIARRDARYLLRAKPLWGRAAGRLISAALAHRAGDSEAAITELDRAITKFDGENHHLVAWCARYRRGQLRGGSVGSAEVSEALDWMSAQGIVNPEAMARVKAPGFD